MARAETAKLMLVVDGQMVADGDVLEFFGKDLWPAVVPPGETVWSVGRAQAADPYVADIAGDDFVCYLEGVPWSDVEALTADLKSSAKEWPCCVVGFQVIP